MIALSVLIAIALVVLLHQWDVETTKADMVPVKIEDAHSQQRHYLNRR